MPSETPNLPTDNGGIEKAKPSFRDGPEREKKEFTDQPASQGTLNQAQYRMQQANASMQRLDGLTKSVKATKQPSSDMEKSQPPTKELLEKRQAQERVSKEQSDRIATRAAQSPDVREATEQLKGRLDRVLRYMDGTTQNSRPNDVLTIADIQKELDALNGDMRQLEEKGLKFRASDVWGEHNGLTVNPSTVQLRFPQVQNFEAYLKKADSAWAGTTKCLSINEKGFSIQEGTGSPVDTMVFALSQGQNVEGVRNLFPRKPNVDALIQRLQEYNCPANDTGVDAFIDLRSIKGVKADKSELMVSRQYSNFQLQGQPAQ